MLLNRAQLVQAIAACDALAAEFRKTLKADAAADYAENGTVTTWRMPGYTVSASVTHDAVEIVSEAAWLDYVRSEYPTEVETIIRARPAWQLDFLAGVAGRGDPPCDRDGRVIPGLAFRPGGEFKSISVIPGMATKQSLREIAADIAAGRRPLGLPQTVEVD